MRCPKPSPNLDNGQSADAASLLRRLRKKGERGSLYAPGTKQYAYIVERPCWMVDDWAAGQRRGETSIRSPEADCPFGIPTKYPA